MTQIDISGLDKADVLVALFNGTAETPVETALGGRRIFMTREEATQLLEDGRGSYFDYVEGRPMKVDIGGDVIDPLLFDRDNGAGAAARAIEKLRSMQA